MTFEFDTTPAQGANRSADITDCTLCGGDRMVLVSAEDSDEIYAPCPDCHPLAQGEREPVAEDAWWKQ